MVEPLPCKALRWRCDPESLPFETTADVEPVAGVIGQAVAKLFQREPHIQARRDLHRFKQLMETGEISTSARNRRQREERSEDPRTEQAA